MTVDVNLHTAIDAAWEARDTLTPDTRGEAREAVEVALALLDSGEARVAEKVDGEWSTNQWLKKAVLLSFRLYANHLMGSFGREAHGRAVGQPGPFWDKVPTKFEGWDEARFQAAGLRAVPGCVARRGAYIAKNVVLMPSFVNIGAYVDEGTMVDTWTTVGSCAQIGKHCHLSGGVGIGGVLEPLQANPTIIEDNVFVGARSEVAEGVIVGEGAVLSMGVFISGSTKIIDRKTGEVHRGKVPPYPSSCPASCPAPMRASPACPAPSSSRRWTPRRGRRPASTSCCGTNPLIAGR